MIVALFSVSFLKLRVLRKYNNRPIININISMFNWILQPKIKTLP